MLSLPSTTRHSYQRVLQVSENMIKTEVPAFIEALLEGEVILMQAACARTGHANTSMSAVSSRKSPIVAATTDVHPAKPLATLRIIEIHPLLMPAWLARRLAGKVSGHRCPRLRCTKCWSETVRPVLAEPFTGCVGQRQLKENVPRQPSWPWREVRNYKASIHKQIYILTDF